MKELIEHIVAALVDDPDQVKVGAREEDDTVIIELTVAKEDLGRVIKEVIKNKNLRQDLAKNRGEFINEYLYLADGRSSRRQIDLIEVLGR